MLDGANLICKLMWKSFSILIWLNIIKTPIVYPHSLVGRYSL